MSSDTSARSLAKTINWRITGSGATFAISYIVLGDVAVSGTIAVIQLTFNTALYFVHERIWNRIKWGQKHF
jgi:uncharacterized membrane protein